MKIWDNHNFGHVLSYQCVCIILFRSDKDHILKMSDLEEAAREEVDKGSMRTNFRRQDSSTGGMYN